MNKANSKGIALDPVNDAVDTTDIPERLDFSHAVRGRAGVQLVMDLTRLRQALRTIRDWPSDTQDPREAIAAMQQEARRALDNLSKGATR